MLHTKFFEIGSWKIEYFPKHENISGTTIFELERFINGKWLPAVREFPSENTESMWAGLERFGVPSPIIRVEMSPLSSVVGPIKNRIYSIGKRPALLGTLAAVVKQFPEHRKLISSGLSGYPFNGVVQIGDFVQDDKYVADEILRVPYYTEVPEDIEGKYFWVRTDPHGQYSQKLLRQLDAISLVPVSGDGCNTEFIALGMAKRLSVIFPENDLPWDESFVVKPVQGTWGENVEIYHQEDADTKNRIRSLVEIMGPEKLMIQPYIPCRTVERDGRAYHEILKLYFVYLGGRYTYTGGMIQGSPERRVCGISGTYFIPLLMR